MIVQPDKKTLSVSSQEEKQQCSIYRHDMELQDVVEGIKQLSGLELAVLLSLISQQHCLIETGDDLLDDLASELSLVARL